MKVPPGMYVIVYVTSVPGIVSVFVVPATGESEASDAAAAGVVAGEEGVSCPVAGLTEEQESHESSTKKARRWREMTIAVCSSRVQASLTCRLRV